MVSWNTEKTYLRDLAAGGIPVVPTQWLVPDGPVEHLPLGALVIKPAVGVGGVGVAQYEPHERADAVAHARDLQESGQIVLVQPYLASVESVGEVSLVYLAGQYSHAVRRRAVVRESSWNAPGSHFVVHDPSEQQLGLAGRAMRYLTAQFGCPLYARVDMLESPDGPVVNELEVTDPVLHLRLGKLAPVKLARAILDCLADSGGRR